METSNQYFTMEISDPDLNKDCYRYKSKEKDIKKALKEFWMIENNNEKGSSFDQIIPNLFKNINITHLMSKILTNSFEFIVTRNSKSHFLVEHLSEICYFKNVGDTVIDVEFFPKIIWETHNMRGQTEILKALPHYEFKIKPHDIYLIPPGTTIIVTHDREYFFINLKIDVNEEYFCNKFQFWNEMLSEKPFNSEPRNSPFDGNFANEFQTLFYKYIQSLKSKNVDPKLDKQVSYYIKSCNLMLELDQQL